MCLVLAWEILPVEAKQYEIPVIFLQISMAIDPHEESRFIADGIFTNPITRPCTFVLYYILSMFMGGSRIKIAFFVGLGHSFCVPGSTLDSSIAKNWNKNGRFTWLWSTSSLPNLGSSAKNLDYILTKVAMWSISVVGHTCRVIHITSPSRNLKNVKNRPERPSGAMIDALAR